MSDEITIVAIIQMKPNVEVEFEFEFEEAVQTCVENTRNEVGCKTYNIYRDANRSDQYFFIERWTNRETFVAHQRTPHFLNLADLFKTILSKPPQLSILNDVF